MQVSKAVRHWLLLIVLSVLGGCAALESKSRMEQLDNLTRGYAKALAWSDFATAYSATQAALKSPLPETDTLKGIKITAYEPAASLVAQDGQTIRRVAQIRYVHTSRMAERSLSVDEEWVYSEEAGRWFLVSGFPQFR